MRRELEWKQNSNSRGKVRPGFRVNCKLSRVGHQSRVTGWLAQEEGGSPRLGVGSRLGVELRSGQGAWLPTLH